VWDPPQLTHRGGAEEQHPGVALRLPLPGQVGFGHRCIARVWLREQMGQTGSVAGHLGATWPKPQQFLHCVYLLEEYARSIVLEWENRRIEEPIAGTSPGWTETMTEVADFITLAGIACIIMREVYATIGESIYPNPSFLSRDFPEASGRLLRNLKEFTFQDMAN